MRLARTQSPPAVYPPGFNFKWESLARLLVLIDGLNTFHAIKNLCADIVNVDFAALVKTLNRNLSFQQVEIIYFTARVEHLDSRSRKVQFDYLENLRASGVKVSLSEFRSHLEQCFTCGVTTRRYSEKKTDVAIASELVAGVLVDGFDDVLLFSADSDFFPALELIRTRAPRAGVKVVSTAKYLRPIHGALTKIGLGTIRLSPELVSRHQFS
ncbi:hypothetical protein RKACHI23_00780 [Rhodoluna lacicola]|nr:hypothetical protein RKACHI23_00780 [Rhodoluna lacicola]